MPKTQQKWTDDQDNLVREIIGSYSEDGRVRWAKAFGEHPEWAKELTSGRTRAAVMTRGNEIMRGQNRLSPKQVKKSKRGQQRGVWTDEQNQIVRDILDQFTTGKGKNRVTDYAGAFEKHPEWREALSDKSPNAVYAKAHHFIHHKSKSNGTVVQTELVDGPVALQPVSTPKWEVNACPNCTNNVRIMNDAYARKGIQAPPHCPFCTFPLKLARNVINIALRHPQGV